jgi:hypothetical protein
MSKEMLIEVITGAIVGWLLFVMVLFVIVAIESGMLGWN